MARSASQKNAESMKASAQVKAANEATAHSPDSFAAMLEQSFGKTGSLEGKVVKGLITAIDGDSAIIDVGLKSEGRVPLREFALGGMPAELKVGDTVEVFLERMEGRDGEASLSREKAKREESWVVLQQSFDKQAHVTGIIFGRVKGGFTVDLNGAMAFLPGCQVDIRPVRDVTPLMGTPQPFQILKMDRARGNIVVSRRAVLEESRAEARSELVANLKEGQILQGVVKNITDYGAFVDLGGVDGLLHVTDIAWKRINHPSEVLQIGQPVNVQVIRFNAETQRISLGMKQLESDPWEGVVAKYPVGLKLKGRVTNITDYGAFVELEPGIEGLVHVSEMSWTKKNVHPGKIVSTEPGSRSHRSRHRHAEAPHLARHQAMHGKSVGPIQAPPTRRQHVVGRNPQHYRIRFVCRPAWRHRRYGAYVRLRVGLGWRRSHQELSEGPDRRPSRFSTSTAKKNVSVSASSSLTSDPFEGVSVSFKKGDVVTCTVSAIQENGIEVTLGDAAGASPASSSAAIWRVTVPNNAQTVSPSAKRSMPRSPQSTKAAQGRPVDQGARSRRRKAGDGRIWFVGFRCFTGRHPRRRHQEGAEEGRLSFLSARLRINRRNASSGGFVLGKSGPV